MVKDRMNWLKYNVVRIALEEFRCAENLYLKIDYYPYSTAPFGVIFSLVRHFRLRRYPTGGY